MAQEDVLRNWFHIVKSMVLFSRQVKFMTDWEPYMIMDKWVWN